MKRKQVLALLLAVAMTANMSMPAFAAAAPVSGSIFWGSEETVAISEDDLAAAMAAAVKGTDAVSEGAEKEETVYVFTDANGKQKSMTVSNWLKNKDGADKLYDNSILQNIENVKGDEPFTQNGDILTWNAGGNDIYYQGTTDKAAPITQKITYYLDGKEIAPEDLAGKSGKVKIHIDYDNSEKYSDVFVPFTTMTGIIFSNDNVKNVEVDNGSVISEGKNTVVVGMAFPGLSDSLQSAKDDAEHLLDETEASQKSKDRVRDLEIPDSVEITMDATDFKMSTCMTMVFSGLFDDDEELEEDHDSMLKDMDEKIADLEKDGADLADGAGKLSDGINEATDGSKELADGAGELASGIKEYTDGVSQVNDGASQISDGTQTLVDGLPTLTKGLKDYTDGVAQADSGAGQLKDGISQYTGGVTELNKGAGQLKEGAGHLTDSLPELAGGLKQYTDGVSDVDAGVDKSFKHTYSDSRGASHLASDDGDERQAFFDLDRSSPCALLYLICHSTRMSFQLALLHEYIHRIDPCQSVHSVDPVVCKHIHDFSPEVNILIQPRLLDRDACVSRFPGHSADVQYSAVIVGVLYDHRSLFGWVHRRPYIDRDSYLTRRSYRIFVHDLCSHERKLSYLFI